MYRVSQSHSLTVLILKLIGLSILSKFETHFFCTELKARSSELEAQTEVDHCTIRYVFSHLDVPEARRGRSVMYVRGYVHMFSTQVIPNQYLVSL